MYESTEEFTLPTRADNFYKLLLFLYPKSYRDKFGEEMLFLFHEIYEEELNKKGRVGISFWFLQFSDIIKSVIEQHISYAEKYGMKKYLKQTLHINIYNIVGVVLLLPIFAVTAIDIISRIAQGNLTHYSHPVYNYLSHTPLYWLPVLYAWVILFPLLAIILNLIPIVKNISKNKKTAFSSAFVRNNLLSILLLLFGLGFLAIIRFHDFAPCLVHGLLKEGLGKFFNIVSVCRNA